jgi:dTDP-4-dehydrorhamnose 3,5-epimerase
MKLTPLGIKGAWLAELPVWSDDRGFFREWFKREEVFTKTGLDFPVNQANISISKKGVIRGIHYSLAPNSQSKWITCVGGSIKDVIVDIRPLSPTFKKVEYVNMSAGDGRCVLIGAGLGHGFISLEENSSISYLLSSPYSPEFEFGISPFDIDLNINWGESKAISIISTNDKNAPSLRRQEILKKLPNEPE